MENRVDGYGVCRRLTAQAQSSWHKGKHNLLKNKLALKNLLRYDIVICISGLK